MKKPNSNNKEQDKKRKLLITNYSLYKLAEEAAKKYEKHSEMIISKYAIPIGTVVLTSSKWVFRGDFKGKFKTSSGHRGWISGIKVTQNKIGYAISKFVDGKPVLEDLDFNKAESYYNKYYHQYVFNPTSEKAQFGAPYIIGLSDFDPGIPTEEYTMTVDYIDPEWKGKAED